MRSLVHPRLLDRLTPSFYPSRATIERAIEARTPDGGISRSWVPVAGMVGIPASVSPMIFTRTGERRSSELTARETTHRIGLVGSFPTITAAMRIVVTGGPHEGTYDAIRPDRDSQGQTTVLEARTIVPVAEAGL